MAKKPNYSFEKRRKEQERKTKREEKRLRKREQAADVPADTADASDQPETGGETEQPPE